MECIAYSHKNWFNMCLHDACDIFPHSWSIRDFVSIYEIMNGALLFTLIYNLKLNINLIRKWKGQQLGLDYAQIDVIIQRKMNAGSARFGKLSLPQHSIENTIIVKKIY